MSASPSSLLPNLANDPNVKPPYSNTQISESAMHQETIYIYRTARPETRIYYERGHYMEGDTEENWIIKWLLWHVFRYRDNRNRGRAMPTWITRGSQAPESPGSGSGGPHTPQSLPGNTPSPYSASQQLPPIQYPPHTQAPMPNLADPLGECIAPVAWSAPRILVTRHPAPMQDRTSGQRSHSQGYWDPVRDAQRTNRR
ncbi:Hypothetical protein D9617_9g024260 [Elsinoe fawcettii]|nr:Hypothetical protein D9617_9g024260 [Elsinoe fawcettii]